MRYALPVLITLALLLTGCGGITGGSKVHDFCALSKTFRVSAKDELTKELADDLLIHNDLRRDLCK